MSGGKTSIRVASLCNLGNTCFLNSVLYTLRFTPGFSHSLHHLACDLGSTSKAKNGGRPPEVEVIERLHELFRTLKSADDMEAREPVPPSSFLQSVSRLNPMFEGNRQQDAHELLMMILDMIQEIRVPLSPTSENGDSPNGLSKLDPEGSNLSSKKGYKRWKSSSSPPSVMGSNSKLADPHNSVPPLDTGDDHPLPNFIKENFVGKAVMSTRCMECEMSTHRSEPFTNIDIALQFEDDEDLVGKELFLKKIMASETLKENNKYWCEECSRLNEAQRSVTYELLPKIMVLQLKRFTATGSKTYMSKINDYIPTPFSMDCFCTKCTDKSSREPRHHYRLYAVIMHLGGTLASGHYISYVRASDHSPEYSQCQRGSNSVEIKNIRNSKKPWIMKCLSKINNHTSGKSSSGGHSNNSGFNNSDFNNGSFSSNVNGVGCHSTPFKCHLGNGSSNNPCGGYLCCGLKSLNLEPKDLCSSSESLQGGGCDTSVPEDFWLECDDESINVISRKQFEDILSSKQGATTPYLLFYQKY
uniref:Ubiquitin carboxylterminal hydrolase 1like [Bombus terrestris] n=1 Tax=Lepeophtheirus salmonis TaxID=72036 RepID=A0A0K2UGW7_LEPSM